MGLAHDVGFAPRSPNAFHRLQQNIAASRIGAAVYARTLDPIDSGLYRLTGGKVTVPGLMAALPLVMLTTIGARTGKPRSVPLLGIPWGDDIAVLNTNFGREAAPHWTRNLEANPRAELGWRGHTAEVSARRLTDTELEHAFAAAAEIYPGYPKYLARVSGRDVRGFALASVR